MTFRYIAVEGPPGVGKTELANAFNPYWDARLVDTSYLDRITALAINQRQLWLAQDFTAILTSLQSLLQAIFP